MKPLLFAVLLCLSGVVAAEELHMCAHKRTGVLRLDDSCRRNEKSLVVSGTTQASVEDIYGLWNFNFSEENSNFDCRLKIKKEITGSCYGKNVTSGNAFVYNGSIKIIFDIESAITVGINITDLSADGKSMNGIYSRNFLRSEITGTVTATKVSD
jgi:hypothetical protein